MVLRSLRKSLFAVPGCCFAPPRTQEARDTRPATAASELGSRPPDALPRRPISAAAASEPAPCLLDVLPMTQEARDTRPAAATSELGPRPPDALPRRPISAAAASEPAPCLLDVLPMTQEARDTRPATAASELGPRPPDALPRRPISAAAASEPAPCLLDVLHITQEARDTRPAAATSELGSRPPDALPRRPISAAAASEPAPCLLDVLPMTQEARDTRPAAATSELGPRPLEALPRRPTSAAAASEPAPCLLDVLHITQEARDTRPAAATSELGSRPPDALPRRPISAAAASEPAPCLLDVLPMTQEARDTRPAAATSELGPRPPDALPRRPISAAAASEPAPCLLDVLRMLPPDARTAALGGGTFGRQLAGCRAACRMLRELVEGSTASVRLVAGPGAGALLWHFPRCTGLVLDCRGYHEGSAATAAAGSPATPSTDDAAARGAAAAVSDVERLLLVLTGVSAEARARISAVHVLLGLLAPPADAAEVLNAVAQQLPCVEVIEVQLDCKDYWHRLLPLACSLEAAAVTADALPRLQRLALPMHVSCRLPANAPGALATWPLRELSLCCSCSAESALGALAALPHLELLSLRSLGRLFDAGGRGGGVAGGGGVGIAAGGGGGGDTAAAAVTSQGEHRLVQLLGARRPPHIRELTLELSNTLRLDASYAQGLGGTTAAQQQPSRARQLRGPAAQDGGWGFSSLRLKGSYIADVNQVARVVLAAAASLRQRSIPALAVTSLMTFRMPGPGGRLAGGRAPLGDLWRLAASSGRVELHQLWVISWASGYGPDDVVDVMRVLGLPRRLLWLVNRSLHLPLLPHGGGTRHEQTPSLYPESATASCAAAGSPLRRCCQPPSPPPPSQALDLDTARPAEVLREAVDRLWAAVAATATAAAAAARTAERLPPAGVAGGVGASGGRPTPGVVLLRGALPPTPRDPTDGEQWGTWLGAVLHEGSSGRLPGGRAGAAAAGVSYFVAVPAAGAVLLTTESWAAAAALAGALCPPSAAAASPGGGAAAVQESEARGHPRWCETPLAVATVPEDALVWWSSPPTRFLSTAHEVLHELWESAGREGAAGSVGVSGGVAAGAGAGGGGSRAASVGARPAAAYGDGARGGAAAAATAAGTASPDEAAVLLARLHKLMVLDCGMMQMCVRARARGEGDWYMSGY
ncbi:hypothetical protein HYH02_000505 [Chlamydomonas schloesseri]|uniref:Uncharacterized protein n=1 Tax=Chlamydomonas schloesseri TaxID=2026947 RepID=A0A835WY13_9CHLO|nr:hypothetical protein HYH02_000505 [Chlamydomonas schloesseri]|eukprot:KAG2454666.1 hypothetical protein HYH02_000505 [Chlamydomonas schloesseri]